MILVVHGAKTKKSVINHGSEYSKTQNLMFVDKTPGFPQLSGPVHILLIPNNRRSHWLYAEMEPGMMVSAE